MKNMKKWMTVIVAAIMIAGLGQAANAAPEEKGDPAKEGMELSVKDAEKNLEDAGEDIRAEAGMVKLTSMVWGARSLDKAIQIHGAMGESLELPLTLFYRYLRHGQIGGGANEIQRMQIARKLLR